MKNKIQTILLILGDITMLVTSFFLMLEIAFKGRISEKVIDIHFTPFLFVFGIWILVFFLFNLYETRSIKPTIPYLGIIGIASLVSIAINIILFYTVPFFEIAPKTNLVIFSTIFIILFIAWRRIFYNIFSKYFKRTVAFVIEPNKDIDCIEKIKNYIETHPQSGFFITGIYFSVEEFIAKKDKTPIDTLIISKHAFKKTKHLIPIYGVVKKVLNLTYAYESMLSKIPVDSVDETWLLENIKRSNNTFYKIITLLVDKVVAFIILIAASPLLIVIALLIKLSDGGPIFYTQLRVGKGDRTFKLYKFRSMIVNSELNGAAWVSKNDNRITSIGKIIRKLHIDEIPQMVNIIKGDLSLVGPRPERPEFVTQLENTIPHYELRHIIRPGFTGWAQIKYKYANTIESSKEKFEYDLYYVKNRNIFIDIGIILRTIQIIFTH